VSVDVFERQSRGQHEDLGVVEQLADLLGRALGGLVLGGHPGLGGLLDDLLADGVDTGVEGGDGSGRVRALSASSANSCSKVFTWDVRWKVGGIDGEVGEIDGEVGGSGYVRRPLRS
jgi:hypothetical protein